MLMFHSKWQVHNNKYCELKDYSKIYEVFDNIISAVLFASPVRWDFTLLYV